MHAITEALGHLPRGRHLLAVSGGRDSMVLLHAFAAHRSADLTAVATFDHSTGSMATAASELVIRTCLTIGVPVVAGRSATGTTSPVVGTVSGGAERRTYGILGGGEATWRTHRWSFLRAVAEEHRATIVTAHTLDDQAETVAMRILRGASARGLAAMAAPARGIARPLLTVRRHALAAYAADHDVPFVEDPSNVDPAHLRNRLRADLLLAADAVRPGFVDALVTVGQRAAAWRRDLARLVDRWEPQIVGDCLVLEAGALDGLDIASRAIVWPELAGRVGVALDRRGVARAAHWSHTARAGQQMPLSGGAVVERTARTFVLRPPAHPRLSGR